MKNRLLKFFKVWRTSPAMVFVSIASIFGILVIFLMPPFTGGDEEAHFIRAYGITQGRVVLRHDYNIEMPKSYLKTLGCFQTGESVRGEAYGYKYYRYGQDKRGSLRCALTTQLHSSGTELIYTTAAGYSPTTYVPQVLAILIGRLFDMPIVVMMYMARLLVMVAYIAMIVFAIKLLPVRKWALVGIALLPQSILHFSNPGGDYMLYGAVSIFVAAIVRSLYLDKKALSRENTFLLMIVTIFGTLMSLPKGIFPGIVFLPLIAFYGGLKHKWRLKALIAFAILTIGLLWQRIGGAVAFQGGADGSLNSIWEFPFAFLKTLFYNWGGNIVGGLGVGGLDGRVSFPAIITLFLTALFIMYLFVGYEGKKWSIPLPRKQLITLRLLLPTIIAAVIAGSFAALFIAASYLQDGSNIIKGVQDRYFYPAWFMLAIIPVGYLLKTKESHFRNLTIIGSFILLSTMVVSIMINFRWGMFG